MNGETLEYESPKDPSSHSFLFALREPFRYLCGPYALIYEGPRSTEVHIGFGGFVVYTKCTLCSSLYRVYNGCKWHEEAPGCSPKAFYRIYTKPPSERPSNPENRSHSFHIYLSVSN